MTQRLVQGLRRFSCIEVLGEPRANIVFCRLPQALIEALLARNFGFYHDRWGPGVVRLVTSFATTAVDVDYLLDAVRQTIDASPGGQGPHQVGGAA